MAADPKDTTVADESAKTSDEVVTTEAPRQPVRQQRADSARRS